MLKVIGSADSSPRIVSQQSREIEISEIEITPHQRATILGQTIKEAAALQRALTTFADPAKVSSLAGASTCGDISLATEHFLRK